MRVPEVYKTVEIPEKVDVAINGRTVRVKGEKGELTRDFFHAPISISLEGSSVVVQESWPRKKQAALVGTLCSHIKNMITGVTEGFTYKLKIVFSHFPISVKVSGRNVLIENFTGERHPRLTTIMGDTQVVVRGDDVIVQGINIEDVSQTAANIQLATKIKKKDPRVFLDGIYIYEKSVGMDVNS